MSHMLHVFPLIILHELTPISDACQWNANYHFEQTIIDDINYQLNSCIYVATEGHCHAIFIETGINLIVFDRPVYREIQLIFLTQWLPANPVHLS